jgi:hypothetical protein
LGAACQGLCDRHWLALGCSGTLGCMVGAQAGMLGCMWVAKGHG